MSNGQTHNIHTQDSIRLNPTIEARLTRLEAAGQTPLLRGGLKGLEKESLRLTADARLAQTGHRKGLGSALTPPCTSTDYPESLIELITPPHSDPATALGFLEDLHGFVVRHLEGEFLLATSMPIGLAGDDSIPIARYGRSNVGMMKHLYRVGLAWRYGRTMQSIAGVHFNFSVNEALWPVLRELEGDRRPLGDFINDAYFGVVRNVHRYGWLLIYLFGSSPAVCRSFFEGREDAMRAFLPCGRDTLFRPHATSLRMSDIGYRNDSQASLDISLDNLDAYVTSLSAAINQPYPPYQAIGVRVDGEWRQLNANILQIENEYYSPVRPKQVAKSCEKPTTALRRRGVRYLELRMLDLAPWEPAGIGLDELRFLEAFTLFCLLAESPPFSPAEKAETGRNSLDVACCGRGPEFRLMRRGQAVALREWAAELFDGIGTVADILDAGNADRPFRRSVERFGIAVAEPERTPAARMLSDLKSGGESFAELARRLSLEHAEHWRRRPLSPDREREFRAEAESSLERQRSIEAADSLPFEEFLQRYFDQIGC